MFIFLNFHSGKRLDIIFYRLDQIIGYRDDADAVRYDHMKIDRDLVLLINDDIDAPCVR